jgi:hypothetical protein
LDVINNPYVEINSEIEILKAALDNTDNTDVHSEETIKIKDDFLNNILEEIHIESIEELHEENNSESSIFDIIIKPIRVNNNNFEIRKIFVDKLSDLITFIKCGCFKIQQ